MKKPAPPPVRRVRERLRPGRGLRSRRRSMLRGGAVAVAAFLFAVSVGLPKIVGEGLTTGVGVALHFVKSYAIFMADVLMNNLTLVALVGTVFLLFKVAGGLSEQRRRADIRKWTERED